MTLEEFLAMPIKVPKGLIMPKGVKPAMDRVRRKHKVSAEEVFGKSRMKHIVEARKEFIALLFFRYDYDPYMIAHILNLDHTSVRHHLGLRAKSKVSPEALRKIYA
jgi:chromosomal replication initiation ATPase DnaA